MLLVVLVLKVTVKQYAEAELTAVSVSHHSPSPFLHSLQTFRSRHPDSQNLPREAPHFSLQKKRGCTPTPQGCHYRDQIVLWLLYSFLLLLFFNLKTLLNHWFM